MSKVTLESLRADYELLVGSIHPDLLDVSPDQILSDCKPVRKIWAHIPTGIWLPLKPWIALNLYAVAVKYEDEEEGLEAAMLWKLRKA